IGAYPAPPAGKSILVIGRALDESKPYDYKSTLWMLDQMAADYTAQGNSERIKESGQEPPKEGPGATTGTTTEEAGEEKPVATEEELHTFADTLKDQVQTRLVLPEEVQDDLKNHKLKKLKVTLTVGINEEGNVTKLELTKPSELENVTNSLVKAINGNAPYKDVPHTKEGTVKLVVKMVGDEIKVAVP